MGKGAHCANLVVLGNLSQTSQTILAVDVHRTGTANTLTARSIIRSMDDVWYLRNTKVGSCSFLILNRASNTMVPQLRFVTNQYFILVHINSVLLIMRLIISLIIETEDGENLVVLLLIKKNDYNNRLAISGIDLHIRSSCHKTLRSSL